jgi:NADP-dependent 3-hydroxy acid dehydrogenase YdfG
MLGIPFLPPSILRLCENLQREMTARTFTSDDQLAFARLSGDSNPLHMNPTTARRLLFGQPVVHGLHALLWGVDEALRTGMQALELRTLKADFRTGIRLGRAVNFSISNQHERQVEIRLEIDETPAMWIQAGWVPSDSHRPDVLPKALHEPAECLERSFDEAASASGMLPLYLDRELAAALFPNLMRLVPPLQVAALLATTRLVGMECPGLHSIYSGLNLEFFLGRAGVPDLSYHTADGNRRLRLLLMDVEAPGMRGQVKAFFRPAPQAQAAFADVRHEIEPGEFSEQRALIIGGSRGLGEVVAKLLAAGGAEVVITYCHGKEDATRIVQDIVSHGAKADCLHLNVLEPPGELLGKVANRSMNPLYLYYFATPFIFGAGRGKFSSRRFAGFCEYYVTGFLRIVQAVTAAPTNLQKIFYPSSAAVEELPLDMGEYAAAKMAGEILCDFLQKTYTGLCIHKPRLPRVATDQTVSLLPIGNLDPSPVLLSHLRHLRQMKLKI